ncbi:MAG: hypothetical protein H0U70_05385 [Tatlockia sp.]|nr:hypothetical protein [Tatlockia sp.]
MDLLMQEMMREAAILVCTAKTLEESVKIFIENQALLKNCKFIFASTHGATPALSINQNFSATGVVRSLFKTNKIWVLDQKTLKEMHEGNGGATFAIDYSVSLDTQALSYLEPYIYQTSKKIPADFAEVFEFLSREDVNVDPMPYLQENLLKHNYFTDFDKIFSRYKCYEILRTLDLEHLRANKQIRSYLSDEHLNIKTQQNLATIIHGIDDNVRKGLTFRVECYYCIIMKIAIIHFNRPKLTLAQKMDKILDFMDKELTTIFVRELIIAYEFFKQGTKLKFFGKIQNNNLNILRDIRNMAWDFFHIRQLEETLTIKFNKKTRYFFPSLLTFDKKFNQIIEICPLKVCAYFDGVHQPMPFYDDNAINNFLNASYEINERYFSNNAKLSRNHRRKNIKNNIKNLILACEIELSQFCTSSKDVLLSQN